MEDIYGWHFGSGALGYGDGRAVVVGETLRVNAKPVLCVAGLHASVRVLDALRNARSTQMAYRVRLSGKIAKPNFAHPDKHAATERTAIAGIPFDPIARLFVRDTLAVRQPHLVTLLRQAGLDVHADQIAGLDMYGDLSQIQAAAAAAGVAAAAADATWAAWGADGDAARAAAWAAARAAAGDAARDAARDAAWAAARPATAAAARAAARDAARDDLNDLLERRLYTAMGTTATNYEVIDARGGN